MNERPDFTMFLSFLSPPTQKIMTKHVMFKALVTSSVALVPSSFLLLVVRHLLLLAMHFLLLLATKSLKSRSKGRSVGSVPSSSPIRSRRLWRDGGKGTASCQVRQRPMEREPTCGGAFL